ncbi:Wadjet anti-phage system protein JetA family protein [uncultured Oscillibacter sp.]|uniref:Wadjet anti-phage system protein JetA family protein n=1 Tax=uncultured Oscillibacter sp. TaxID=876091 RepID=UPI002602E3C5|nr:Wadjet anti-phage system protein JetA family protein [uncultured Oscillibacter sp.]
MKLFDAVPNELFSVLASPNRSLYADALDVLYESYQENLKIPEERLYSMLRGKLEQQLAEATFEGEDIDEEELRDVSGRARFLIRKLNSKGWLEKQRGEDFNEYITVPGYSSRLLELFHQLRDDSPMRGYSYVFGTYSTLKVASEGISVYDKMAAVYSAYDNTQSLIKLLQMVYHNVKHFFQRQINMQEVNVILASHFDDFGQKVVEAYIRPLKIKDSVPKYRVPIQKILTGWLEDDALLTAMSNAALQDRRGSDLNACRSDLLRKIFWVKERYDNIEHEFLDEIDQQVRRYTRATTQKIENLTNRDHNVRGNLNYLLTALSRNRRASELVEQIQPAFQLYEQSFLSEKSVWYRKRPGKRTKADPVLIQEGEIDPEMARQAQLLLHSEYGRSEIAAYVEQWLGEAEVCYSEDLNLEDDKAYIMSLLAVLTGGDRSSTYTVRELEGVYSENGYSIPRLQIKRREEKT